MFVGRVRELKELQNRYEQGNFECVIMYGRRRIGKTALISEFIKDKSAVYYMGIEGTERQNLENFSRAIWQSDNTKEAGYEGAVFSSFQNALESIFQRAEKERLILAIDEYPYIARSSMGLSSVLQMLIDKYRATSKLMIILCGSSMSYMEDEVLAYKAPLYGRRTAQIKVQPFTFDEFRLWFSDVESERQALFYGLVGGTPQYMMYLDKNSSVEYNIKKTFLNPLSFVYEEPENLLKQEVRDSALYYSIITAVANGASRLSEVSDKVGIDSSTCANYIKNLVALGLIRRETPYGEKISRRSLYRVEDNLFRFWFRFIPRLSSIISRAGADGAYGRIGSHLSEYMGLVFEDICRQFLWNELIAGSLPVDAVEIGRWWGTDKRTRSQTEIDIMATDEEGNALFGECKWTNEPVDAAVLKTLVARSELFSYAKKYLYVFSKSGFTSGCREEAERLGNVKLLTYGEDFYS